MLGSSLDKATQKTQRALDDLQKKKDKIDNQNKKGSKHVDSGSGSEEGDSGGTSDRKGVLGDTGSTGKSKKLEELKNQLAEAEKLLNKLKKGVSIDQAFGGPNG